MLNLIEDTCTWCETRITRPSENMMWVCDYESAECDFHPISWNSLTLAPTGNHGPHQTKQEMENIVKHHWAKAVLARDKTFRLRSVDSNVVATSHRSQRTSRTAGNNLLPHSGTIRRLVYEQIKEQREYGRTDNELETVLHGKHQTISASRRSLVLDGWIVDSGKTRKNAQGNECIVWVENSQIFSEVLFNV